jgi:parallel beta-helix repeat protein
VVEDGTAVGNGAGGVRIDDSPSITLRNYGAHDNGNDGVRIDDSAGAVVENNAANDNGDYGFRVGDSPPIDAVQDLIDAGNTATGNVVDDFRVDP